MIGGSGAGKTSAVVGRVFAAVERGEVVVLAVRGTWVTLAPLRCACPARRTVGVVLLPWLRVGAAELGGDRVVVASLGRRPELRTGREYPDWGRR
ncbi:MAG: hypothetical protein ACJ71Y_19865 [Blastococcus sp.]